MAARSAVNTAVSSLDLAGSLYPMTGDVRTSDIMPAFSKDEKS